MTPEAVFTILKQEFADGVTGIVVDGPHPHAKVDPDNWHEIALFLRDDPRMGFDWLRCLSGVDHIEDKLLTVVYDLHATQPPDSPGGMWTLKSEIAINPEPKMKPRKIRRLRKMRNGRLLMDGLRVSGPHGRSIASDPNVRRLVRSMWRSAQIEEGRFRENLT